MSMRNLGGVFRAFGVAAIALATCGVMGAQIATPAGPKPDPTPSAIDAIFSRWGTAGPGVSLAVIRDEKVIYSHGYGMASLEHSVPISANTVFDIGSTSKQFTAACILLLAQEGKLAIADDVRKYLPDLPKYEKPITIAHLLHHTSGLRDYADLLNLGGLSIESNYSVAFLLKVIYRQRALNFPPGERFSYSNTGYFLLGEIVHKVSGMPLASFAKARIFDPLGMTSTLFMDDHLAIMPHRAQSYFPRDSDNTKLQTTISLMDNVGDGGVYTTTLDLAKWDANFYHNILGAGEPAKSKFLDQMQEVGLLNNGQSTGYASGLFIGTHRGQGMVSHGGAWQGFRAELVRFPDHKLSVICLANLGTIDATRLALRVADLYLPEAPDAAKPAEGPTPAAPSAAQTFAIPDSDWERYTGRYKVDAPSGGPIWTVTRSIGALAISSTTGLRFAARPIGALEFESTDRPILARLVFTAGDDGKIASITQSMPDAPDVRLTPIDAMPDRAAGLADFEGKYDSDETGGSMEFTVSGGRLHVAYFEGFPPYPIGRDEPSAFSVPGLEWLFTRGGDGNVDGVIVSTPRTRGVRYVKRGPGQARPEH